jgi:hypothetical protein
MFLGREGFYWWIGIVEDNVDPILLGRVKVRIFGYHSSYAERARGIPTADLPWATIVVPPNGQNTYSRIGLGEWVVGFFMDGADAQEPIVLGIMPTPLSEGAVTSGFGRYGTPTRSFPQITTSKDNYPPNGSADSNYSRLAQRMSIMSEGGHQMNLIDHSDTDNPSVLEIKHKNGSSFVELRSNGLTISNQGKTKITFDDERIYAVGPHGTNELSVPPPPSGGGGGKIICTKLYELGYLSKEIYELDQEFGQLLVEKSPDTYYGYIAWAQTVVDWMEGNGPQCMFWIRDSEERKKAQVYLSTKWAREIATPWASHMAYLMGDENEKNVTGRVLMTVGKPICKVIGVWQRWFGKSDQPTGLFKGFLLWGIFAILRFIVWFYRNVK